MVIDNDDILLVIIIYKRQECKILAVIDDGIGKCLETLQCYNCRTKG